MILNKKFIYPTSSRALFEGERHYDVNAEKLPSVTTILQATQPVRKKISARSMEEKNW
jgi:hypothetical protein